MGTLESELLAELRKPLDRRIRYNFTLSKSTKAGLAKWCKEHDTKESRAVEAMIRKYLPKKYFKA